LAPGAQEIQDVVDAMSMDSDQAVTLENQAVQNESQLPPENIPADKATVRAHLLAWVEGLAAPDVWGGADAAKDPQGASASAGVWAQGQLAAAGQLLKETHAYDQAHPESPLSPIEEFTVVLMEGDLSKITCLSDLYADLQGAGQARTVARCSITGDANVIVGAWVETGAFLTFYQMQVGRLFGAANQLKTEFAIIRDRLRQLSPQGAAVAAQDCDYAQMGMSDLVPKLSDGMAAAAKLNNVFTTDLQPIQTSAQAVHDLVTQLDLSGTGDVTQLQAEAGQAMAAMDAALALTAPGVATPWIDAGYGVIAHATYEGEISQLAHAAHVEGGEAINSASRYSVDGLDDLMAHMMVFDASYLDLETAARNESASYMNLVQILKTKHDTVKNSIGNIR
jgi:hypothetical protein